MQVLARSQSVIGYKWIQQLHGGGIDIRTGKLQARQTGRMVKAADRDSTGQLIPEANSRREENLSGVRQGSDLNGGYRDEKLYKTFNGRPSTGRA